MAEATIFDTLATVRRLEDAGVGRKQAEAHADALAAAMRGSDLVTKSDMQLALAALEARLTVRLYGAPVAAVGLNVGLTVALLKLLP